MHFWQSAWKLLRKILTRNEPSLKKQAFTVDDNRQYVTSLRQSLTKDQYRLER